jgi:uncharacterized protein YjiS (DUF1127 family)
MQSISMYQTQYRSTTALLWLAGVMQVGARRMRNVARSLEAWLERRQVATAALIDFSTMSDRDLLDIGLTRVDVNRVAWGASDRNQDQL